jgi:hypothetical protein
MTYSTKEAEVRDEAIDSILEQHGVSLEHWATISAMMVELYEKAYEAGYEQGADRDGWDT